MATFYNQATLSFGGRVTNSNVTEGEVLNRVAMNKVAVTTDYGPGDNIVYAVTLVNNDATDKVNITITDNLGRFTPTGGPEVVPLTYVPGSVIYYQNGILQPAPAVNAGPPLLISDINIPAGGNVTLLYEVRANEYAPLGANASINNNVSAGGCDLCEGMTATANIPTRDEPQLTIAKAVCPDVLSCGDTVTYTFIIQNTGNTAVVATDDLVVADNFTPVLCNLAVTINGQVVNEGIAYTYDAETGAFTTLGGALPVPAATFTRDPITGIITTTPGVTILTVTGTI